MSRRVTIRAEPRIRLVRRTHAMCPRPHSAPHNSVIAHTHLGASVAKLFSPHHNHCTAVARCLYPNIINYPPSCFFNTSIPPPARFRVSGVRGGLPQRRSVQGAGAPGPPVGRQPRTAGRPGGRAGRPQAPCLRRTGPTGTASPWEPWRRRRRLCYSARRSGCTAASRNGPSIAAEGASSWDRSNSSDGARHLSSRDAGEHCLLTA